MRSLSPSLVVGARFGQLTILSVGEIRTVGTHGRSVRCIPVLCDCGTERWVQWPCVRRGMTTSCGCFKRTHGDWDTPLYKRWVGMTSRCTNPNEPGFKNYGGRGIVVCQEWREYVVFRKWALANGYSQELQIDRIDNNGNYGPDNCHFVTSKENNRNRRSTRMVTAFGETKCLNAWIEDERCKISRRGLMHRLNSGIPPEEAISTESSNILHNIRVRRNKE